ncbi:hypothetical protein [Crenobacter luteus]|uniref:Uncharacterized protein n=1 Tax=Crenobacter luteus TaxID=1452487 RepID=A0A163CKS0_9NEIS|nr:hypothetical protein [Crenobacter luteus]KZE32666.1 hypothetical protein AVW16_09735 [Crenobacter luteus]
MKTLLATLGLLTVALPALAALPPDCAAAKQAPARHDAAIAARLAEHAAVADPRLAAAARETTPMDRLAQAER